MKGFDEEIGETAYKAYCAHTGNKSLISGCELPTWDALKQEIKNAWIDAAFAVVGMVPPK
jgi:hypothetical protein